MRVAIIEDEVPAAARLASLLSRVAPDAELVATWPTLKAARAGLSEVDPLDLLLCDVRLGDGSVFTLFEDGSVTTPVIFTTSYDDHLLDAFANNGIGYLLKPVDPVALTRALGKAHALEAHFVERLREPRAAQATPSGEGVLRRFLVRRGVALQPVPVEDAAWFLSQHRMLFLVHRDGRRLMMDGSLAELEPRLDPDRFFRLDRRVIAQLDSVVQVRPAGRGRLEVDLRPGSAEVVRVSQANAVAFKRWLEGGQR